MAVGGVGALRWGEYWEESLESYATTWCRGYYEREQ